MHAHNWINRCEQRNSFIGLALQNWSYANKGLFFVLANVSKPLSYLQENTIIDPMEVYASGDGRQGSAIFFIAQNAIEMKFSELIEFGVGSLSLF